MRIAYPWWICPGCKLKLIPADRKLDVPDEAKELRLDPGSHDKPIPQPNRPPIAAPPRVNQPQPQTATAAQSHKP